MLDLLSVYVVETDLDYKAFRRKPLRLKTHNSLILDT